MLSKKVQNRLRIRRGIRKKIFGTAEKPRISIFRSNTVIYAQVIDDEKGNTLVASSSKELKKKSINVEVSKEVGKNLATKILEKGIQNVVFDRGGYLYHGNIKALADGIREGGIKF